MQVPLPPHPRVRPPGEGACMVAPTRGVCVVFSRGAGGVRGFFRGGGHA